ncbi:hypothetical protein [Streptomyces sp. NBC_01481]|uniref:hypothetical protein n=1 Tax=Streptomyces sp. NBC_01481 TaxID=2975869 RepID=UPI002258B33F|nr:hypothetical protein [Streptomyces sp. NBC_01481]MCX4587721.1 hypothetical protein [Streptomyces sp. NBC_01481]
MDAGVLVGAVFGLCGTVVGGGLSIWASIIAQRQQAKAARQLVIAQRVDTAVDAAIQAFFQIKQHIRGRPSDHGEGAQQRNQVWQKALQQQVLKVEPTVLRIRDEAVRMRLDKIAELLSWPDVSEPGLGGSDGLFAALCDHALDCLGACARDEPLPEESRGLSQAREVEANYLEVMEERAREYQEGYH